MTIKIGSVSIDAGSNRITVLMPAGFDTIHAVRLTNYTNGVAQLNNVMSNQASSEVLHACTSMVWRSPNVSSAITITLLPTYPSANPTTLAKIATALVVEASDDPENDFTGTYPYPVPVIA